MRQHEERQLLLQLKAGSDEAYEAIYHLYNKRLFSFTLKYLKSRELSEDAVHDTFIKLWDNRKSIHGNLKSYLFSTARNHVLNMIRNRKRKILKHIQIEQQRSNTSNKTEEFILYSEYQTIFREGLDQLPDKKREIFLLKTEKQLSNADIAARLGITIHTVKSQYYEASRFIKDYLNQNAGIHPNRAKTQ